MDLQLPAQFLLNELHDAVQIPVHERDPQHANQTYLYVCFDPKSKEAEVWTNTILLHHKGNVIHSFFWQLGKSDEFDYKSRQTCHSQVTQAVTHLMDRESESQPDNLPPYTVAKRIPVMIQGICANAPFMDIYIVIATAGPCYDVIKDALNDGTNVVKRFFTRVKHRPCYYIDGHIDGNDNDDEDYI